MTVSDEVRKLYFSQQILIVDLIIHYFFVDLNILTFLMHYFINFWKRILLHNLWHWYLKNFFYYRSINTRVHRRLHRWLKRSIHLGSHISHDQTSEKRPFGGWQNFTIRGTRATRTEWRGCKIKLQLSSEWPRKLEDNFQVQKRVALGARASGPI